MRFCGSRLSWSLQLSIHFVLLLVAFFGLFLGFTPDLLPGLATRPRWLAGLQAGLATLDTFDDRVKTGKAAAILSQDDDGFSEVYTLLREFDNTLPLLQEMGDASQAGNRHRIVIIEAPLKYGEAPHQLQVNPYVSFERVPGEGSPVCFVHELKMLARQKKARFWSTWGLALTSIAVFVDVALGVWGLLENKQARDSFRAKRSS